MSVTVPTAFVEQYSGNLMIKAQQFFSRLRRATMEGEIVGNQVFFDQIGRTKARVKTTRHAKTPLISTDHERRAATMLDLEWADLIDTQDQVRMLIQPQGKYTINGAAALLRALDDIIIGAATGIAQTGQKGTVAVPLPASQKVPVGLGAVTPLVSVGMNLEKMRLAKRILTANEAVVDGDPLFMAMSAVEVDQLLADPQLTSADFNTVKTLVDGDIKGFMGFEIIRLEGLAFDVTTGIRTCFAWAKSGIGLGMGKDVTIDIGVRRDLSIATQVYLCLSAGATRIEEEKVVEIPCDETPV